MDEALTAIGERSPWKVGMEPAASKAAVPTTARLYVLDCGMLNIDPAGVARYHVTQAEVVESRMPVPCFLVVHPKGTLLWDAKQGDLTVNGKRRNLPKSTGPITVVVSGSGIKKASPAATACRA